MYISALEFEGVVVAAHYSEKNLEKMKIKTRLINTATSLEFVKQNESPT